MPPDADAPLILHAFSTFATGGSQTRFAAIANHFGPRWRHAIVAMDGNLACRERLDPAVPVDFPQVEVRRGDTLGNVRRFRRALRTLRPAALLTYNWGTIEWAMANYLPIVRHAHVEDGFGPDEAAGQKRRRVLLRRLLLRRRLVVVPSQTLFTMATQVWRLRPERVRLVPNGIDLQRFTPRAGPSVRALSGTAPVVGTVATLRPEKNLSRLLRAFRPAAEGTAARLVVIGDGPDRPALEALAGQLGIAAQVEFTGTVRDPAAAYRGFDVFAMSSDTEQMPISLLEAMGTGLPVAATDVGDIQAMLPASEAPFVTPLDDAALAAAMRTLLLDPALCADLGQENRCRAEAQFDQDGMFSAWAAIMDGTPQRPSPSPSGRGLG